MAGRLWLDDVKDPPNHTWTVARSVREAQEICLEWLEAGIPFTELSIDHDLGMKVQHVTPNPDGQVIVARDMNAPNGMDFLRWMRDLNFWPAFKPEVISMNIVEVPNMRRFIDENGPYG